MTTARLTPHLVRVTVTGPDLARFAWVGPAAHLKLILPEPGATDVELPTPDADGTVVYAPGAARTMRTYTARRFEPATGELDLDLVLHGHGPAATWAAQAAPGHRLAVTRPRGAGFTPDPTADWLLLAGDAAALPAIATILEAQNRPAAVLLELDDDADRLELGTPVDWLLRSPADAPGAVLARAVATFAAPAGRGQVWVATEAGALRAIRGQLLASGLAPDQITTRGYWRAGEANHPDHDNGQD
jgi:NADPH-dependent ferric siderophore reductase